MHEQDETFQVQFTGDARTFFGIWIVNLLLSIVTLGIYSAWAKVRTKRYFAQNTLIDERRFEYHATGKQILIGRIIVLAGFLIYSMVSTVPIVGAMLGLLFLFVSPYLINRSLRFNARMTSFSGLRFGFNGSTWHAVKVFLIYPVLSFLTLFTTWPFVARAQQRYYVGNHRFGTSPMAFESTVGPFYKALMFAILWAVFVLGAVIGITVLSSFGRGDLWEVNSLDPMESFVGIIPILFIVIAVLPAGFIYRAYIRNAVYAAATLEGGHRFASTIGPFCLMMIAVTNALAIVVSFGLLLPWARIRMARYLAQNTYITVLGTIDTFVGREQDRVGALGDAFTDLEGIDVDFAL